MRPARPVAIRTPFIGLKHIGLVIGMAGAVLAGPAGAEANLQMPPSTVYFESTQASLTQRAQETLAETARRYRAAGAGSVIVAGHTATIGDARQNVLLSQTRANTVRDYLVAQGVPGGVITVESYGEERPLILTPDNDPEPLNDRVEITFGPSSGW